MQRAANGRKRRIRILPDPASDPERPDPTPAAGAIATGAVLGAAAAEPAPTGDEPPEDEPAAPADEGRAGRDGHTEANVLDAARLVSPGDA